MYDYHYSTRIAVHTIETTSSLIHAQCRVLRRERERESKAPCPDKDGGRQAALAGMLSATGELLSLTGQWRGVRQILKHWIGGMFQV
jgi:hypothetical protein